MKATTVSSGGLQPEGGKVAQELQRGPALNWPGPEGRELTTVRVRQVAPQGQNQGGSVELR